MGSADESMQGWCGKILERFPAGVLDLPELLLVPISYYSRWFFFFHGLLPFYPSALQCEPVVVLLAVPKDLFHPPVVLDFVFAAAVCYPLLMLFCSGNAFHHFEIVVGSLVHGRQALKGNAVGNCP